ncbi:hypothetical protein [Streptomyces fuscigenes]|uniref:hypothetical protein n=1 Tax=Streptomyces fuscigenes TaxID=1528880 RepID=UPI001F44D6A5|nr:hypothetical protein [Streptomyces fuscigenes]MCF3960314.1 hypothetical protein [Streptomyces fuscigenes]
MPDEHDTDPVFTLPVTTVRLTWLDKSGNPDHQWAVTYRFTAPLTLTVAQHGTHAPNVEPDIRYLAALSAPHDHPERDGAHYLTQNLRRRTTAPARSLEAWTEPEDDVRLYALLPHFTYRAPDEWPITPRPGHELHAAGRLHRVNAYSWPAGSPQPMPGTVQHGNVAVLARTDVPPPPPGFPTPAPIPTRMTDT